MHEVLVNRLGGLSLPRKSVVRLTDHPDMTLDVYRGRKTTIQYNKRSTRSVFYDFITKYTDIFVEKNERSFCTVKAFHIFFNKKKNGVY